MNTPLDIEGAICDECGQRIGPHGCCATIRSLQATVSEQDELYSMKLHDEIVDGQVSILRVPGGWIYSIYCYIEEFEYHESHGDTPGRGVWNGKTRAQRTVFVPEVPRR